MSTLWKDLVVTVRRLKKTPGFTVIAVLSLALGIGANTAIFSFVNKMFLRPLPVAQPEQLVALNAVSASGDKNYPTFSVPNYRDLRDRNDVLSGLITYRLTALSLSNNGVNTRLWGYLATGNYFEVLGVQPALGRLFTKDDDKAPGAHPVTILSYDCWRQRFAGDPQVIGKEVLVNAHKYSVIGVAPPGFQGTELGFQIAMWFPSMMIQQIEGRDYLNNRDTSNFFVQGRLKPGITMAQAEAALNNIAAQLADSLIAVVCQRLRFRTDLNLRVPECEILRSTNSVKTFIRNRDFFKIPQALETGAEHGMWSFDRYQAWMNKRAQWHKPNTEDEPPDQEEVNPSEVSLPFPAAIKSAATPAASSPTATRSTTPTT